MPKRRGGTSGRISRRADISVGLGLFFHQSLAHILIDKLWIRQFDVIRRWCFGRCDWRDIGRGAIRTQLDAGGDLNWPSKVVVIRRRRRTGVCRFWIVVRYTKALLQMQLKNYQSFLPSLKNRLTRKLSGSRMASISVGVKGFVSWLSLLKNVSAKRASTLGEKWLKLFSPRPWPFISLAFDAGGVALLMVLSSASSNDC